MVPFCLKVIRVFAMFGGCPYFVNKALGKECNKQLRSYDPANWKKWSILVNEPGIKIFCVPILYKVVSKRKILKR